MQNNISAFKSDKRQICSTYTSNIANSNHNNNVVHAQTELDSHADSIVTGSNCCIMYYAYR